MHLCMRPIQFLYAIGMHLPLIWLVLCIQMNEPFKNTLGCNLLF